MTLGGHKGLVGSAILRALEAHGYTNIIYRTIDELDLTRQADVEKFFNEEKPEYVFLAAAKVGGIHANNTYPAQFIYENLMIESNIIHKLFLLIILLCSFSANIFSKFTPNIQPEVKRRVTYRFHSAFARAFKIT